MVIILLYRIDIDKWNFLMSHFALTSSTLLLIALIETAVSRKEAGCLDLHYNHLKKRQLVGSTIQSSQMIRTPVDWGTQQVFGLNCKQTVGLSSVNWKVGFIMAMGDNIGWWRAGIIKTQFAYFFVKPYFQWATLRYRCHLVFLIIGRDLKKNK